MTGHDEPESSVAMGRNDRSRSIEIPNCFDGQVISWSVGTRSDADLVNTMLDAAIEKVANSNERPVVHFDRGARLGLPLQLHDENTLTRGLRLADQNRPSFHVSRFSVLSSHFSLECVGIASMGPLKIKWTRASQNYRSHSRWRS